MARIIHPDVVKHLSREPSKAAIRKRERESRAAHYDALAHYWLDRGEVVDDASGEPLDCLVFALGRAEKIASDGGHVASLPDLVAGKALAAVGHPLENRLYLSSSVEYVAIDTAGYLGKKSQSISVVHHGIPLEASRVIEAVIPGNNSVDSIILSTAEINNVLSGKTIDGTEAVKLYSVKDVESGKVQVKPGLKYGIWVEKPNYPSNSDDKKNLLHHPLILAYTANAHLGEYLKKTSFQHSLGLAVPPKPSFTVPHARMLVACAGAWGFAMCTSDTPPGALYAVLPENARKL